MPNPSVQPSKLFLIAAAVAAVVFAYGLTAGAQLPVGIGVGGGLIALAFYFRNHPTLHIVTFTLWLTISTIAALFWPGLFL